MVGRGKEKGRGERAWKVEGRRQDKVRRCYTPVRERGGKSPSGGKGSDPSFYNKEIESISGERTREDTKEIT